MLLNLTENTCTLVVEIEGKLSNEQVYKGILEKHNERGSIREKDIIIKSN